MEIKLVFKSCDLLCWFFFFFWHLIIFGLRNWTQLPSWRHDWTTSCITKRNKKGMLLLTLFLKKKRKTGKPEPTKKNQFTILFCTIQIWMNFCGVNLDVLLCSNQACLPAVSKYTLASQQYSLVVNYLMYSRNERTTGSVGRHAYRVTHAFTFLHYYTQAWCHMLNMQHCQSLNRTFFIFPHRERVHKL